jgi:hypothetical protein
LTFTGYNNKFSIELLSRVAVRGTKPDDFRAHVVIAIQTQNKMQEPQVRRTNMYAKSRIIASLFSIAFIITLTGVSFADTIRLKDGTTVKGKVIGFKDQQFIVLIGDAAKSGRRSQLQLYIEDVEAIEFDNNDAVASVNNSSRVVTVPQQQTAPRNEEYAPVANTENDAETATNPQQKPAVVIGSAAPANRPNTNPGGLSQVINSQPIPSASNNSSSSALRGKFFSLNLKVLADSTANGWTNSGIVVRKGQRLRISSTGRVSLGGGRFATPAGVGSIADGQRLMPTEPTGALIAVIGDDNNDFIFVGNNREFVAQRDGTLFLGINEGNLNDNSGAFETIVEAEAIETASTASKK